LTSKRKALEACEFYEVYQTPVGKAEDGVDVRTEQKTLSKSSRIEIQQQVNELVQDTRKRFDRRKVEVDHQLVLLQSVEQLVYDMLLNMTNIL